MRHIFVKRYFFRIFIFKSNDSAYKVESEDEALKCIWDEKGVDYKEIKYKFNNDPLPHIDTVKEGMKLRVEKICHSRFNIPFWI